MGRSGTTTYGFRITKSKNFEDITPRSVGWLGERMVSFWLRVGTIMSSIVGSESCWMELGCDDNVADDGDFVPTSGRIGQSVINSEESLPSQGPKWQKHNHTAAVKVCW
jgi:hypothetical protein